MKKHLSEEHKKKIGDANRGRKFSKEICEKWRQIKLGKKLSKKHKKALSEGNKRRYSNPEERKKTSKALKKYYRTHSYPLVGEKSPTWRGGVCRRDGYVYIYQPYHPFAYKRYVKRATLVIEKMIGRFLKPEEIVHHKNGIRDDDRPENLELFANSSEHSKYGISEEHRQKLRLLMKNNKLMIGRKHSTKTKQKISQALKRFHSNH